MKCVYKSAWNVRRRFLAPLILFAPAFGAAQVNTPPVGIARLQDSTVRKLYGIPANIIVGAQSLGSFDAASFSDEVGLVAKNGRISLVTTNFGVIDEYETAELQPLLNVDGSATSAIAWLPASQALLRWNGTHFVLTVVAGLDRARKVTSVRLRNGETAQMLMADTQGRVFKAEVSLESGAVLSVSPVPGAQRASFWQGSLLLFQNENGLGVLNSNGVLRTFTLGADDISFDHISRHWVLVTSRSEHRVWALQASGDAVDLSEVPSALARAREVTK